MPSVKTLGLSTWEHIRALWGALKCADAWVLPGKTEVSALGTGVFSKLPGWFLIFLLSLLFGLNSFGLA